MTKGKTHREVARDSSTSSRSERMCTSQQGGGHSACERDEQYTWSGDERHGSGRGRAAREGALCALWRRRVRWGARYLAAEVDGTSKEARATQAVRVKTGVGVMSACATPARGEKGKIRTARISP